jgi:protein-tyrosine kinase
LATHVERIKKALDLARVERERGTREQAVEALQLLRGPAADGLPEDTAAHVARARVASVNVDTIRANRLLLPGAVGVASGAFKMLRTQVLQRLKEHNWHTLAVVSPTPGDGKTFTAINLAIAISGDTSVTSVLVDLDLRRPSIHARFGIEPGRGVEECLRGEAQLADVMVNPQGYERLLLLPGASSSMHNSSDLLASESARRAVRELKERYQNDIVLFDLPPVLGADDALSFIPQVDAALVVVRDGKTHREDLLRLFEVLRQVPVVGTVVNGSRKNPGGAYAY